VEEGTMLFRLATNIHRPHALAAVVATLILLISSAQYCLALTDVGKLNRATFRIDVPAKWNGSLVVYCHGYSDQPIFLDSNDVEPFLAPLIDEGYAVVQSGYSVGGWAIEEGIEDTKALKEYFAVHYGSPKQTYVIGESMGAFIAVFLVENSPRDYDGVLAVCGPLLAPSSFMARQAFDFRVVFDYFFPRLLPSPINVPQDFAMSAELA